MEEKVKELREHLRAYYTECQHVSMFLKELEQVKRSLEQHQEVAEKLKLAVQTHLRELGATPEQDGWETQYLYILAMLSSLKE